MNEALGGSMLFNILIVIVSALVLLLVGFLAFSKAFKVKNHILNFIHEDNGVVEKVKIENDLTSVGYSSNKVVECSKNSVYSKLEQKKKEKDKLNIIIGDPTRPDASTNYDYCVYKFTMADGSYYYTVVTYVHMNIPIIDGLIHIPITGETRIFERQYE